MRLGATVEEKWINLQIRRVAAAEGGTSNCAPTTLATEILPRNRKNSRGGDSSGSRSSPAYSRHALKCRILLIPPAVARIEEIRRWIGVES